MAMQAADDWYSVLSDSEASDGGLDVPDPDRLFELKRINELLKSVLGFVVLLTMGLVCFVLTPGRGVSLMVGIPIVASLFTWFHIWLAIKMMFYPIHFWGYEISKGIGIGWQGVVPRKAEKMARIAYAKAKPHSLSLPEIFERVDAAKVVSALRPRLDVAVAHIVRKVASTEFPKLFAQIPSRAEVEVSNIAMDIIEKGAPDFFAETTSVLCLGVDIETLIITAFVENRALLNSFFQRMGHEEFHFVERMGAVMGLMLGFVQLSIYHYLVSWQRWLFLPFTGFFLGMLTNWLAIQACFRPVIPYRVRFFMLDRCALTFQGLFLKRQDEVCQLYASLLCRHFMNLPHLIKYLRTVDEGRVWEAVNCVYNKHVNMGVDNVFGKYLSKFVPARFRGAIKDKFATSFQTEFMFNQKLQRDFVKIFDEMTDVERTNAERLSQMTPEDFEQLLHPVFQEDEWILISLGAVLGAIVGIAQVSFLGG